MALPHTNSLPEAIPQRSYFVMATAQTNAEIVWGGVSNYHSFTRTPDTDKLGQEPRYDKDRRHQHDADGPGG